MNIYIAIDDTDNLDEGATGAMANDMIKMIQKKRWGSCEPVTRHQLLLHPDIPYTSHNSSMCFILRNENGDINKVIEKTGELLQKDSVLGSDPGLCIAVEDHLSQNEKDCLIQFGYEAKKRVMHKEEAYALAQKLGIHLSEHGGTGLGVIGALAGVGLRMTQNDGRFQGKLTLKSPGDMITVGEILAQTPVDQVQSVEGEVLAENEKLFLGEKLKTVLINGKRVFLVFHPEKGAIWESCTNVHIEKY